MQENTLLDDRQVKTLIYDIFQRKIVPLRLFQPIANEYATVMETNSARTTGWWLHNLFTSHIKHLQPAPKFRATARLGKFLASTF